MKFPCFFANKSETKTENLKEGHVITTKLDGGKLSIKEKLKFLWRNLKNQVIFSVFFLIIVISLLVYAESISRSKNLSIHVAKQRVIDFCNIEKLVTDGDEGKETKFALKSVLIVLKNGEVAVFNKPCRKLREEEEKELKALENELELNEGFRNISLSSKCTPDQLTEIGALESFRIGKFLKKKYSRKVEGFETIVTTRAKQKEYASSVAFLAGFGRVGDEKLDFKIANYSNLCTSNECNCPNYNFFENIFEKEKDAILEADEHTEEVNKLAKKLNILDVCKFSDLWTFRQILVSDWIITSETKLLAKMFENDQGITRRFEILNSLPVLKQLADPQSSKLLIVTSDGQIFDAVFNIFGIRPEYKHPAGSRLVFEIYSSGSENLMKILYNGVDMTEKVKFCELDVNGMCRIEDLKMFLETDLFKLGGFQNFNQTCNF